MNWKKYALIGVVIFCMAILSGGLGSYLGRVQGKVDAAEDFKKTAGQQMADAEARITARDKALADTQANLEAEKRALNNAADAIRVMSRIVPASAGTVSTVTKDQLPPEVRNALPDSPGYTIMPDATAVAMGKRLVQCEQDQIALGTCEADLVDRTSQRDLAKQSANKWETAAKGGSKWQRLKKVGLFTVAAGGGAAVGATKGPQGAAIGAAGGVIVCAIFCK